MSKFKTKSSRAEQVFFPESIDSYISEIHMVRLIDSIVERLDFSPVELKYSDLGQNGYEPKILTAILFYGYTIGINSSRKLSDACLERFDFRYLTFNQFPSYKTISEFRRENLSFLKDQFTNIVLIGLDLGLADFGNIKVSIDGSKIRANASSKRSKNLKGLKKLRKRIEEEIIKLLMNSEIIDREEADKIGNKSEHELPKKLQSKRSYVKSIDKAIHKLTELQFDMKQAELSEKGHITKSKMRAIENQKINITDHEAKFMKERNGCIRTNYNGQISVDEKNQFVLANDVCNSASDQHQLIPLIEESEKNISGKIKLAKGDSGYENVENLKYLESNEIAYLIDSQRRNKIGSEKYKFNKINFKYDRISNSYRCPKGNKLAFYRNGTKNGNPIQQYKCLSWEVCPFQAKCSKNKVRVISRSDDDKYLEENYKKMQEADNKQAYSSRKHTVEPVFGNIKYNNKFYYFLLRGLEKVKGEFSLMCTGHNIKKIFKELKRLKLNFKETIEKVILSNSNLVTGRG